MILEEEKIFNFLNGFSTEEERIQIEEWLSQSDLNKIEFDKIKRIYELSVVDNELYKPDIDQGWSVISEELFNDKKILLHPELENSKSFQFGTFYRITAILVLAIGIAYFTFDRGSSDSYDLMYQTKAGELKELVLADGTEVSLNENTIFRYSGEFSGNKRVVYLEGEAFFNVAKDKNKPFEIESPSASTQVLGTSFNLQTNDQRAKIDVFSGKVAFGNLESDKSKIILTKGQSAHYKNGRTSELSSMNSNASAWKTGKLKFEGTSLSKVVQDLEKLYKVEIEYDQNIAACAITSTFENESLVDVLKVIEAIAQINNSKKNGVIYLSGTGC